MPPRYAYWTILVDDQPTAFRASSQEDLMPTFKRLKLKHPSAKMMWWQNGKLWDSRLDAQEAMHARGEMGRRGDVRQGSSFRDRARNSRTNQPAAHRDASAKLEWRPKSADSSTRDRKSRFEKPQWKPKDAGRPHANPASKAAFPARRSFSDAGSRPIAKGRPGGHRPSEPRREKLDWKPKGESATPKRKWIPKEEFKKSRGIEARRDKNWRPGGEHKDPRQKYKDAKKAKWGRFKQTIRKRWESKQGKKKKDDE
jgi:hypothetical protein